MQLIRFTPLVIAVTLFAFYTECFAQQSEPKYSIKSDEPPTGSIIRRDAVSGSPIPINRRYEELTPPQRTILHGWWEAIPEGDEPPFPLDGLSVIYDAMRRAQMKLRVSGDLSLVATVNAEGKVTQVNALGSPSPEMTKFAASVLFLTKFKPAVCGGRPCAMDFPLLYSFRLEW